jgi:hypothetical protein
MTSILKVDTIQDADGNNIINESGNTITIGASGDTTNIIGTLQNDGAAVGGTNTPAFAATLNSTLSVSNTTWTELTNYGGEVFDTDNNFASSRFTPTTAGKYFFYASAQKDNISAENYIALSKNGSTSGSSNTFQMFRDNGGSNYAIQVSGFFDMNGSSDYVSVFVYQQSGSSQDYGSTNFSYGRFIGYKLIGV